MSCNSSKDRTVIWEFVDSFVDRTDSCLFRKCTIGDTIFYEYDFDFDNFKNPTTYKLLRDSSLILSGNIFLSPVEIVKIVHDKKQIDILKYESPNSPPGGQGCWLFNIEYGLIGNGSYVGEKMVVKKNGELLFIPEKLKKLMHFQMKAPPPSPNDY